MAYKVFQNGYPLSASELNNYLMNQTVMVFASAAERTSVLTAPVEGMVTWLQDTNVFQQYNGTAWVDVNDNTAYIPKSTVTTAGDLIIGNGSGSVTRLGIGAANQALISNGTTAAWGTPASGGMTLLNTFTLNGVNPTISGISQSYKKLVGMVYGATFPGGVNFRILTNGSATTHYMTGHYQLPAGGSTAWQSNNQEFRLSAGLNVQVNNANNAWWFEIDNYSSTASFKPITTRGTFIQGTAIVAMHGSGAYYSTSAVSSLTFSAETQSISAGTVLLYGVS